MTAFVALYCGETIASAKVVAVTADPSLVRHVATRLLGKSEESDPVLQELERGKRQALRLLRDSDR